MKINELQARQGNVELVGKIKEKGEAREFEKFGKTGKVCNAVLADDTGEVKLTLWNEQADQVKDGDTVKISNGWVGEYQGEKQLSTGKFGKLEVVEGGSDDAAPSSEPTAEAPAEPEKPVEEKPQVEEEMID
jgi:replication factor A1